MNRIHHHNRQWNSNHIAGLLLLTLACYWPLALGVFSAKNDNVTQFLPVRFHVSEALRNGHLPLWSPYMYLGYPIHGDMQGGAWNPVVWLLSLFGRYNLTSIHAEILVYIFLGGLGCYRLLRAFKLSYTVCFTGAAAYLMCGYITDVAGSNLPFLAAAAFLPFVFAYGFELIKQPAFITALKTSVALWLLFVTAYPSFFICAAYVLLAALIAVTIKKLVYREHNYLFALFTFLALSVLGFLVLSAPAIFSYWEILPFYHRSEGVSLKDAGYNPFSLSCTWSYILPGAPIKDPAAAGTDPISRNGYFNLVFLLFFFCLAWSRKNLLRCFIAGGMLFFFLFSLGSLTPVRAWSYHLLPLMDTFRHPANARLFVLMGGIVLGAMVFNDFRTTTLPRKYPMWVATGMLVALSVLILVHIPYSFTRGSIPGQTGTRMALKEFITGFNWHALIVLTAAIQIFFLLFIIYCIRKPIQQKWWTFLIILNSFVLAQVSIPFTLVSQLHPGAVNHLIRKAPHGYPFPDDATTIAENTSGSLEHMDTIGIMGFYSKKITLPAIQFTPTFMIPIEKIMKDSLVKSLVYAKPYAYYSNGKDSAREFSMTHLDNNRFQFQTRSDNPEIFCLQQLYLPGWNCFVDGKKMKIDTLNHAFMQVMVPAGKHDLQFTYQPKGIRLSFLLSLAGLLLMIGAFIKYRFRVHQA
jgi:hypothetical protein